MEHMTIQKMREKVGMSRPGFAEYFGIFYCLVQNRELGKRECPEYLTTLIKYKLENVWLLKK